MKVMMCGHLAADEPTPTLRLGGGGKDIPVLEFGGMDGLAVHMTQVADLPGWLRNAAAAFGAFALEVEDKAVREAVAS